MRPKYATDGVVDRWAGRLGAANLNDIDCYEEARMNAVTETQETRQSSVFRRMLVGIDGSEESREAARQAARLVDGELTFLAAYDVAPAIVGGTGYLVPSYSDIDLQRAGAETALGRARGDAAAASPLGKVVRGRAAAALLSEAKRERHTALIVGSHGVGRLAGFVVGSTATEVIRKAPCSVLLARRRSESDQFPSKIVVGVDGSPESAAAHAVARQLAERFDADLWPIVAYGGQTVERRLVDAIVDDRREESPDEPVPALLAAAAGADLLVVGSRGLHGLSALGSVSERVAHRAQSSVLIVRKPRHDDDQHREQR
jgi:nucleotide-binding universal stress UspA family protein